MNSYERTLQAALLREDASQGQERLQRDRDLRAAEARSEAQRRNDSNGK